MPVPEGGIERVPGTRYVRPIKQTEEGWGLRITKSGDGSGVVADDWGEIDCGAICYFLGYLDGIPVVLTATPDAGNAFVGWSGDGSGSPLRTVVMNGNKVVNAEFSSTPPGLIAWYPVDEAYGSILHNIAPAGPNKLPNLSIVVPGATFWSQVTGFGYWDGTTTSVYATWATMFPFPTKAGTIMLFVREAYGLNDGSTHQLFVIYPGSGYASNMYRIGAYGLQFNFGMGSTGQNYQDKTPIANYYNRPFVAVYTHDTVQTQIQKVKYQGLGWVNDTFINLSGFNSPSGISGVYLGQYFNGTTKWKGLLGDLMIWDRLLAANEIDLVLAQRGPRWEI